MNQQTDKRLPLESCAAAIVLLICLVRKDVSRDVRVNIQISMLLLSVD